MEWPIPSLHWGSVYFLSHFCSFLPSFLSFFLSFIRSIFFWTKGCTRNVFYSTFPRTKTSFSRKFFSPSQQQLQHRHHQQRQWETTTKTAWSISLETIQLLGWLNDGPAHTFHYAKSEQIVFKSIQPYKTYKRGYTSYVKGNEKGKTLHIRFSVLRQSKLDRNITIAQGKHTKLLVS